MIKLINITIALTMLWSCAKKNDSLVAYWDFDNVENNMVKDLSDNGYHAIVHDAVFDEGKIGKAFHGDGKGYLEVKYNPALDKFEQGITIAAWVCRDTSTLWNCLITRETQDNWSEYYDIAINKNKPLFSIDPDGKNFVKAEHSDSLPVGQWIHLAGTFDNKTYKLYINGKEAASGMKEMPFVFTDQNPIYIGSNTNDAGATMHDYFFGKIDELKIYNRALNNEEILTLTK
ncbi:MAG: LamG domain-containing protein [Cytophagales bacterium]|nr:LamG domain-containing protein [Cytophagales bacterium]